MTFQDFGRRPHYNDLPNENKLFIGALSSQTDGASLGEYFSRFGVVDDAVVMREADNSQSRCFGFVVFRANEILEHVLTMPHVIDGKPVDVKRALPKSSPHGEAVGTTSKLFIGGIPGGVSDADIKAIFLPFGPVVDAYQMLDQHTKASRGFGFVQFENESSVDAVLEQQSRGRSLTLNGRKIDLKRATPKLKAVNPMLEERFRAHRLSNPYEIPPPPPPGTLRPQRDGRDSAGNITGDSYLDTSRNRNGSQRRRFDLRTGNRDISPPSTSSHRHTSHSTSMVAPSAPPIPPAGMVMVPADVAASVGYYAPGVPPAAYQGGYAPPPRPAYTAYSSAVAPESFTHAYPTNPYTDSYPTQAPPPPAHVGYSSAAPKPPVARAAYGGPTGSIRLAAYGEARPPYGTPSTPYHANASFQPPVYAQPAAYGEAAIYGQPAMYAQPAVYTHTQTAGYAHPTQLGPYEPVPTGGYPQTMQHRRNSSNTTKRHLSGASLPPKPQKPQPKRHHPYK